MVEKIFKKIKSYLDTKLESQIQLIQVENEKLINAYENRIKNLELELSQLKEDINAKRENTIDIEHCLEEINDRATRASNIMIYNAKESKATDTKEKIKEDKEIVSNILSKADLNGNNILKVIRVGRIGIKPRPIKAVLTSPDIVNQVFRCKKQLSLEDIKIGKDQTRMQQDLSRKILCEYRRRKADGESNLYLKYKSGLPTIQTNKQQKN